MYNYKNEFLENRSMMVNLLTAWFLYIHSIHFALLIFDRINIEFRTKLPNLRWYEYTLH